MPASACWTWRRDASLCRSSARCTERPYRSGRLRAAPRRADRCGQDRDRCPRPAALRAGLDARNLPASWSSTGNALEGVLFAAKDALVVIDDFCPTGSSADVQRYHRDADRVFRAQGNRSGRQRMRADATLRPTKPPRGLAISTGEDTPRGQSLRSRVGVLEVGPSDVDWARLTACQADARDGVYARALVGFVGWLAPRYDEVRERMRADLDALRTVAYTDGQHRRTPGIVADLAYGLKLFLAYAVDVGAVTDDEAEAASGGVVGGARRDGGGPSSAPGRLRADASLPGAAAVGARLRTGAPRPAGRRRAAHARGLGLAIGDGRRGGIRADGVAALRRARRVGRQ